MTCLACPAPALGGGRYPMLCLEHAVVAYRHAPKGISAAERLALRGRCWGDALSCPVPAVTVTAHGSWCRTHAPDRPEVPARAANGPSPVSAVDLPPEVVAAVVLTMRELGATVLREQRTYGSAS